MSALYTISAATFCQENSGTEHVNIAYLFYLKSASLAYIASEISLSKPVWLCIVSYKQSVIPSVAPVELWNKGLTPVSFTEWLDGDGDVSAKARRHLPH